MALQAMRHRSRYREVLGMDPVAVLLERLDEYAALRERISHLCDDDDAPTQRAVLDEAVQAWHRLLAARQLVRL